jgi:dTDP-4-dehydrorhamnose reductase
MDVFKRESEYDLLACDLSTSKESEMSLDITDRQAVMDAVGSFKPSVIINAAAYTNVDKAEIEREIAYRVNATAAGHLADAANTFDAKLIHISTDYVFDGEEGNYSEESLPSPINYYGKTKLAGENLVKSKIQNNAIIRTQILYGYAPKIKNNFALWVIEKLSVGESIHIVDDQVGNPTLADELAFAILKVCQKNVSGVFHVSGYETNSRFEFARKISEVFDLDIDLVQPVKSDELNQPAHRPKNSSFICLKAQTELGINMPSVVDSLSLMKQQMKLAGIINPINKT